VAKKKTNRKNKVQKSKSVDINIYIEKYFWLVIPILTIVYFISSKYSIGFYQDDEIGQYNQMIKFWIDPGVILGNNPKPGYKIFMVVPALFGYPAVLIVNSLIASLAVYFTYLLIKIYKIKYAFFGALLMAFQPLFFDLSFRSYSEIFTALCFAISLILFHKEKFFLSSLVIGFIYTIRQEVALLILILIIIFIRRKNYVAIIGFAVFPLIYNILGFLKTGDLLYIIIEMQKVAGLKYKSAGVFHYFKVYIFIVGPISLALFLLGFLGFLKDIKKIKEYIKPYYLFYIIFLSIFIIQIMTMINDGPNPGNWRYLLHISPVCVFFATIGLNNLSDVKFKKTHLYITGTLLLLNLIFFSRESDGYILFDQSDYTKFFFLIIFIALTLMFSQKSARDYMNKLSISLLVLAVIYLYIDFTPKELSAENLTVKQVAEYLNSMEDKDNYIYSNHSLLLFYSDQFRSSPEKFKSITSKDMIDVPKGSLIVWENHYGYRPEWGGDIQFETLQKDSTYKIINQFISSNQRFVTYVFEKVE
jgi:hypothetical protein